MIRSGGASTALSSASAPSEAMITLHTGSRAWAISSRISGLSSTIRTLTVLAAGFIRSLCSASHRTLRLFWYRTAIIAALAPGLFHQVDIHDLDRLIEGLAHVVDGERCGGNGNKRFHLHAGLRRGRNARGDFHAILA